MIGESVETISASAFKGCSSLTSIEIPDSVITIGIWAFSGCDSLANVVIPDSVTSIGVGAFSGCHSLISIAVDENNIAYKDIDGNLYTKDGKTLVQYAIGKTDTTFIIPDGVEIIEYEAFYDCDSLASVAIENSVKTIGSYAFSHCSSLESVVIGNSVETIDYSAFSYCDSLMSVVIGDSVSSIANDTFCNCSSLTSITVDENNTAYKDIGGNLYTKDGKTLVQCAIGKADTSFMIPEGVETIGYYAFDNCDSLTSIVIPDSVTKIGFYAFSGLSDLTDVYYTGTEEEWAGIDMGGQNQYLLTSVNIHYNYSAE